MTELRIRLHRDLCFILELPKILVVICLESTSNPLEKSVGSKKCTKK